MHNTILFLIAAVSFLVGARLYGLEPTKQVQSGMFGGFAVGCLILAVML